jgi:hypothetical protein
VEANMVTKPTINLDGTPPRVLLEQQVVVIEAMRSAISRLQSATPNARDYQTALVGAFTSAMDEHRERVKRLVGVMRELDEIAEHISDHC